MNRIGIEVNNISQVLVQYDQICVYKSASEAGTYTELTDALTRIRMVIETTGYFYDDLIGATTDWYKTSYRNSGTSVVSDMSGAMRGGLSAERVGYTFGNYIPPPGEWGKLYTADDIRFTDMFGIDCVGSDIAQSDFTDAQFDQCIREAVSEFEALLGMDIHRKRYMNFTSRDDSPYTRARYWREGVDYTHEDESYDFDPQEWSQYGFVQLRHWPVLKINRAVWLSPVQGQIMDMIANKWIRVEKGFGQVRMFPTGGFSYGPYSVYGMMWSGNGARRYPGAFEFDYETGYSNSDFVPDGLRDVIAKWATIKTLAVIGDGLMAGFSSQSVSLDGLSESFSSTQSATSAYFGARILEYQKEIKEWLERNRYKYSPVPISFVGAV